MEAEIQELEWTLRLPSFDAFWTQQSSCSPTLRTVLESLDPAAAADLRVAVEASAAPFTGAVGALALPAKTWVAAAGA